MAVKSIIFDLDLTLVDHGQGEMNALKVVHEDVKHQITGDFCAFHQSYKAICRPLWAAFENGEIAIENIIDTRFDLLAQHWQLNQAAAKSMNQQFLAAYCGFCLPFEGARSLLEALKHDGYQLVVCSNGHQTIQQQKLKAHNLLDYFDQQFYGTNAPMCKPHRQFFEVMLNELAQPPENCVFVGDSLQNDIEPAQAIGMFTVHVDGQFLQKEKLNWEMLYQAILR